MHLSKLEFTYKYSGVRKNTTKLIFNVKNFYQAGESTLQSH